MFLPCSSQVHQRSNTLIHIFWRSLFSCLSYLRTESSSLRMNKILRFVVVCSRLLSPGNSLLIWTAGKVWVMSPKPGRGQEQMWASQMDPVNNGLNHRGRPGHINISSLFGMFLSHSQRKPLCAKEISEHLQSEWEFSVQLKRGIWTLNEEKIIH